MSFIWFEYTTLRLGQNKFFSFTSWTVNVFIKNHGEPGVQTFGDNSETYLNVDYLKNILIQLFLEVLV